MKANKIKKIKSNNIKIIIDLKVSCDIIIKIKNNRRKKLKIKNIKINAYGNLIDKNINLKKLNIIYGENESGKSTLLNFIQNILYGISKNKNGKNISDYDKYNPWNYNSTFSGRINYELDNKKTFEVYRDFNKKNPEIYNELKEEISDKFKIDKKLGNQFFLEQTNIDENTFMKTVLTKQREVYIDENNQLTLLQKVANLSDSGMEDVSYKKALSKLNNMLLNEVGTSNSKGRPINITLDYINKYNEELKDINNLKENRFKIEEEYNNIKKELDEENKKNKLIIKIKNLLDKNKLEKEKIKIKNNYLKENNEKIEKIKISKNNLIEKLDKNNIENKYDENIKNKSKKINKNKIINLIIFLLLIILNIFNFIYINNKIINIIIFSLIPIYLIYYIIKIKKNKKQDEFNKIKLNEINEKNKEINNQIDILNGQIDLLEKNNGDLNTEINNINSEILNYELLNKKEIENEFINDFSKEYISDLFNNNLELILNNSNAKINELSIKLHKNELDRENIEPELERLINIEENLSIKEEEFNKLQKKTEEFNLAKDILQEAYDEMKNNISPQFINNFSKDFEKFSNGKYKNIMINDKIMVELENGRYVPAESLSIGTIEQIYLSLRLAINNELSKEKLPIMLDEAFAYYDNKRLKSALEFLNNVDNQVIIFTCSNRERDLLEQMCIEYNYVQL